MRGRERFSVTDICAEADGPPARLFYALAPPVSSCYGRTVNNYCDYKLCKCIIKRFCTNLSIPTEVCHVCEFVLRDTLESLGQTVLCRT